MTDAQLWTLLSGYQEQLERAIHSIESQLPEDLRAVIPEHDMIKNFRRAIGGHESRTWFPALADLYDLHTRFREDTEMLERAVRQVDVQPTTR